MRFSSTFTTHHVLLWVQHVTTCSREGNGWDDQTRDSFSSRRCSCTSFSPCLSSAAAQHSLSAYLKTREWMLLQSLSSDPSNYGWTVGAHGYEPVPTLDPWQMRRYSGSQLAVVMQTAATNGAAARRMVSSVSHHAGVVKASYARTLSMMMQSLEKTQTYITGTFNIV